MEFIIKVFKVLLVEEIYVFLPLIFLFFYSIFYFNNKNSSFVKKFLVILIPAIYLFFNYSYLPNYFMSIGQDSLLELNADFGEAIFFLNTFIEFIIDPEIFKKNRFWLLLISSLGSSVIIYLVFNYYFKRKKIHLSTLNKFFKYSLYTFIFISVLFGFNIANKNYDAGKKLKSLEKNFSQNIKNFNIKKKYNKEDLDVIVYIGESTSALNFSLYGYPFETTPWLNSLKEDKKFIIFSNMYSNHSYTVPSLSNALSICINLNQKKCSLTHFQSLKKDKVNNYISLVDAVKKTAINTYLFSTQGVLGTSNISVKQLLNTQKQNFSFQSKSDKFRGTKYTSKIKDKNFFSKSHCTNQEIFKKGKSNLVFLHSYAGHGKYTGYKNNIEDGIKFTYPDYINKKNLLGKDHYFFRLINEYDTAMSYIDSSIKTVVDCSFSKSNENDKPLIFIYFSDHGESPFSGKGHDAARITYEMLHVPFIIYFNDKAYEIYNDKFKFIEKIKNKNLTLRSLSELILYLFEIDILSLNNKLILKNDDFKTFTTDYLLEREDLDGNIKKIPTLWNDKELDILKLTKNDYDKKDSSIKLWQLNNLLKNKKANSNEYQNKMFCMHRANSFILQYKSSLSIGCFETDIFHFKEKTISAHDIEIDTNLIFKDFLKSNFKKTTVWMDSKNFDKKENCIYGLKWLQKYSLKFKKILVEIPSSSIKQINDKEWLDCMQEIKLIKNIELAYYLNNELLRECSNQTNIQNCKYLNVDTKNFLNKTNIKSITFDYQDGYEAVSNSQSMEDYNWHVWHVEELEDINKLLNKKNIGIILLKNNKDVSNIL